MEKTAEFCGCPEQLVSDTLARALKGLAQIERMEAKEVRARLGSQLDDVARQLQELADRALEAGDVDKAVKALEAKRKAMGDYATLYGANAMRTSEDSADAIADLLARIPSTRSEAERTANEPPLHLLADE